MMNNTMKNQCRVPDNTIVEGKWHRNQYKIIKELGFGANGIVYLAQFQNRYVALKMSENNLSITSEVNVLNSFAKVQGSVLGPSLLDVDDWVRKDKNISFYVMEYIHGPDFLTFIKQKGQVWIGVLILQLLSDLQRMHERGWIFGDLKPENLIVTGPPPKIRCIDVGGTTMEGRAIKEFTEFYDRGYWGLGTRKADPAYDLFAVGMIMINCAYPKLFPKREGGIEQLKQALHQSHQLHEYKPVILKSLQGSYRSAKDMREDLLLLSSGSKGSKSSKHVTMSRQQTRANNRSVTPAKKKRWNN
ncbi:serine/threonine protein kinase [Bacillus aquiflavi]|uniref:serine/threonine protein kinase n=1 Tax=Bacillus aquiflavi TaxID=2672567 RepID=UPI00292FDC4C|nr:protein kinase family protein [Bacillus aquiflavi]